MGDLLQPLDLVLFFAALIFAMAVGLIAGKKEETSEDYFLAGRKIPWWGVAGSIFGSNVSANHMVGMMGIGFSIGFAQSHFELGAIGGLMVLCYGFLPVYRKLNVFTLSEYLRQRYDERSQIAYAVIMIIIMAVVQMVPGLYIGARSVCVLLGGDAVQQVAADDASDGVGEAATKHHVNFRYYAGFVIALAVISASYTILGGLKAVVWTDVIQSVLLLIAGLLVAFLVFREIGGWSALMAADQAGDEKMHLYLPMNHPQLPWTGVFTGLMAMHCFYWGTNQFIVQRALGARSDSEARMGIIAAGFLKLLIPFFAIAAGVAAFYLFKERLDREIAPDTAFTEVVRLVVPTGFGIVGLISAGLIGAILSSIDSMMNSASTIVTIDIYKRYINPAASDREMIRIGRMSIVAFVVFAALMAIFLLDPNSEKNFFLQIVNYQNYLTPGLLVAFALGMLWKRGTAVAAFVTIISGVFFSWLAEYIYNHYLGSISAVAELFGEQLNFFHRVVGVILLCCIIYVVTSLLTKADEEKGRLGWTDLGGHEPGTLTNLFLALLGSVGVFAVLAYFLVAGTNPTICAMGGALWTLAMFAGAIKFYPRVEKSRWLFDDRLWAGTLCSLAVFMLYYFY
jgi:SSS family solute:Na+ symporter